MATNNSTATPKELAAQFPDSNRPFAVWYNPAQEGEKHWVVNGHTCEEIAKFDDMATALKHAAKIGKEWDEEARKQAQALAKVNGHDDTVNLSDVDIEEITRRLSEIAFSNLAIAELALDAINGSGENKTYWMTAIEEMAKRNVRGLDACLVRMGEQPMGNFETEFETEFDWK